MEPVRGGRLAALGDAADASLKALRPDESVPAWAFRWLQSVPGVTVILSGMSSLEQMADNVRSFEAERPLSAAEEAVLMDAVAPLRSRVPCTACRYCCDGCPMELDIPMLISAYNDLSLGFNFTPMMRIEALPEDKRPSACLACGACAEICPQGIPIPDILAGLTEKYESMPKWSDICRQRAEEAARLSKK
jgi:predicted aldo/keto reductase-like oxidoreductase